MGVKEARRLGVVEAALRGKVTNGEGAEALGLSARQFRRLKRRVERQGARGVIHGNRGRASPQRLDAAIRGRVEALLRGEVRLNDSHLRDLLGEESVDVSVASVRRIRRQLGLPPKQRRRPSRHRRRRERAGRRGALVLIDGSPFRWLGLEGPERTLVGTLDDATGEILALTLRVEEDLHGYAAVLHQTLTTHGVPLALYGDGTSIAVRNDPYWTVEEELEGRQRPSHFGLMLEELGIRYIRARSPQAKGRIERLVLREGRVLLERPGPPGPFTLVPRGSPRSVRRPGRKLALHPSPRIDDRHALRLRSRAPATRIERTRSLPRPPANHPWRKAYKPQPRAAAAG